MIRRSRISNLHNCGSQGRLDIDRVDLVALQRSVEIEGTSRTGRSHHCNSRSLIRWHRGFSKNSRLTSFRVETGQRHNVVSALYGDTRQRRGAIGAAARAS